MAAMSKFWTIPLVIAVFVIGPFLIWGETLGALMTPDPDTGAYPGGRKWLWATAIGLLIADIFIPIPTTSIVAALGIVYGPVIGAGVAIAGSMLSAGLGYGIGRILGRPVALRLVGEAMARGERAFARYGGWIVAASRWAPVLPEVVSVVAGVSRMPVAAFLAAAACGVVPFCAVFALFGHLGADWPLLTLGVSAAAPLVLWALASRFGLIARIEGER